MDLDTRLAGDLAALEQGTTGPPPTGIDGPGAPRVGNGHTLRPLPRRPVPPGPTPHWTAPPTPPALDETQQMGSKASASRTAAQTRTLCSGPPIQNY